MTSVLILVPWKILIARLILWKITVLCNYPFAPFQYFHKCKNQGYENKSLLMIFHAKLYQFLMYLHLTC